MKAKLAHDIISAFRESKTKFKVYGKKHEEVDVISDHGDMKIVEGKNKDRYAVRTDELIDERFS